MHRCIYRERAKEAERERDERRERESCISSLKQVQVSDKFDSLIRENFAGRSKAGRGVEISSHPLTNKIKSV